MIKLILIGRRLAMIYQSDSFSLTHTLSVFCKVFEGILTDPGGHFSIFDEGGKGVVRPRIDNDEREASLGWIHNPYSELGFVCRSN